MILSSVSSPDAPISDRRVGCYGGGEGVWIGLRLRSRTEFTPVANETAQTKKTSSAIHSKSCRLLIEAVVQPFLFGTIVGCSIKRVHPDHWTSGHLTRAEMGGTLTGRS